MYTCSNVHVHVHAHALLISHVYNLLYMHMHVHVGCWSHLCRLPTTGSPWPVLIWSWHRTSPLGHSPKPRHLEEHNKQEKQDHTCEFDGGFTAHYAARLGNLLMDPGLFMFLMVHRL